MQDVIKTLRDSAEEMERWIEENNSYGWSTNLNKRIQEKANELRLLARKIERQTPDQ